MRIQAFVPYWSPQDAEFAKHISQVCQIEAVAVRGWDHEPVVLNRMIDSCMADYLWFIFPDDIILNPAMPGIMADYLDAHPEVGVVLPDLEGEQPNWRKPERWYLRDGSGMLYRMSVGARFDEEFIFTGWNDLDFGETVMSRGYEVHLGHMISMRKGQTRYGSWSNFRQAYNARNRLLLEIKWHSSFSQDWRGVDYYNAKVGPEKHLPGQFELAWWSDEQLDVFANSVYMEHPHILIKDNQGTGNENWVLPEICR